MNKKDIFESDKNEYLIKIQEKVLSKSKSQFSLTISYDMINILNLLNDISNILNELKILHQIGQELNDMSKLKEKDILKHINKLSKINESNKILKKMAISFKKGDLISSLYDLDLLPRDMLDCLELLDLIKI